MRVVVVGAGIVGAAVAREAAAAGAEVLLLDASAPASGVSADSFGWIGGPRGTDAPGASTALHRGALAAHRRLEAQVPGVRVLWRGCVTWSEEQDEGRDEGRD
ncbi:FAD-dependent oxidoreductase, partial [Kineococcus indalonis]|uniref:FAD-dependent oxidoreductase n=1 Tax=Kineococcus indalonis TaxID=2696566 RepID=UPI001412BCEC